MGYQPTSETPIANSVGIVHDLLLGALSEGNIAEASEQLQSNMQQWAMCQMRDDGWQEKVDYLLTYKNVTCERNEDTPAYNRYYALTSQFLRKVCQTASAAY